VDLFLCFSAQWFENFTQPTRHKKQQFGRYNKLVFLAVMDRLSYRHLQSEFKARLQLLMGSSVAAS
jgi:hypothetical protein